MQGETGSPLTVLGAIASERRNGSEFGRHQATHGQSWPLLSQVAHIS
jgi:hypothetical protein